VPALKLLRDCGPVANATNTAGDSDTLGGLFGAASTVCEFSRTAVHSRHGEDASSGRVHQLEGELGGGVGTLSGDRDGTTLSVGPGVSADGHSVNAIADDHCIFRLCSFGFGRHSQLEGVAD
jgi:hypothetical protein